MTTAEDLAHHIHQLKLLLKTAQDPKLLWEEMQIIGKKAFQLQEKMTTELETLEKSTQEITAIQMLYATRESMWDIMNQLAQRELELKAKPHPKTTCSHKCCCHAHEENTKSCAHSETKHHCCTKGKKKCKKK